VRTSVLVVSAEPVGRAMAGPAIRAAELARALATECDVTLAAPAPSTAPGLRLLEAGMADVEALVRAAREHDVVLAQELPPTALERIAGSPTRLVVDLYNPIVVEVMEAVAHRSRRARRRIRSAIVARTLAQAAAADLILCANERQRDLWVGGLALQGLIEDPGLIAVVPFGLPAEPPGAAGGLRAAFPQIARDDRVLLWGGGLWGWLDPVTPMRAVALLNDVHLVVMGAGRPGLEATGQAGYLEAAIAEARALGLEGRLVHVNRGWVPYAERGSWLTDADLGVTAHHDHLEARYAHRTRVLDYLWAGLPVVATRGDAMADLVEREGLGRTVPHGDTEAFAAACDALLGPGGDPARERVAAVAPALRWDRVAQPLVEWCATARERPRRAIRRGVVRRATLAHYRAALPQTLADEGPLAAVRRVGRRLRRAGTLR
jgi:glycosyltransferase involved in cell wall biosynthesis